MARGYRLSSPCHIQYTVVDVIFYTGRRRYVPYDVCTLYVSHVPLFSPPPPSSSPKICHHDVMLPLQHNPVVGPWASTQHLGLTQQLQAGVRCLDFRVGFVGAEVQRKDKIKDGVAVVHDKYRTTLSLRDALTAVKKFVQGHPT